MVKGFNRWAPLVGALLAALYGVVNVPPPSQDDLMATATAVCVVVGFLVQLYGVIRKVVTHLRGKRPGAEHVVGLLLVLTLAGTVAVLAAATQTEVCDLGAEHLAQVESKGQPCWSCHIEVPGPCVHCHWNGPTPEPHVRADIEGHPQNHL